MNVLNLSYMEACQFFLESKCYCSIDLPLYFNFQPLLDALSNSSAMSTVSFKSAGKCQNVNYKFYNNKDGMFSWRPFQIINPVLYVKLVQIITQENSWKLIVDRFKEFQSNPKIRCCSIPLFSTNDNDKIDTILNWWENIEQESIELALDYNCFLNTDITDCYGSIYTHSITWALHGKEQSKSNIQNGKTKKLIGDEIDSIIQGMSYAQTNGIPQGSLLMDFIAEMVLGFADLELSKKIDAYNKNNGNTKIEDYQILRYRDDYRIFGNAQEQVIKIAKMLTETLQDLNLKINTQKTFISNNIIKDSIKPDKYYWVEMKNDDSNLQKHLLIIHSLSQKYPNSGSLTKALDSFYKSLYPLTIYKNGDTKALISILVDIAYRNPRVYSLISAIIGKLLILETDEICKKTIYASIKTKFTRIPNIGYLQIWLQRLTLKINGKEEYDEPLCKIVIDEDTELWNLEWLPTKIQQLFKDNPIVDKMAIDEMEEIPTPSEIQTLWVY